MMKNDNIAGAIYDFVAYLTTRPNSTVFGAKFDSCPAADLLKEWSTLRGLDIENPNIKGWNKESPK